MLLFYNKCILEGKIVKFAFYPRGQVFLSPSLDNVLASPYFQRLFFLWIWLNSKIFSRNRVIFDLKKFLNILLTSIGAIRLLETSTTQHTHFSNTVVIKWTTCKCTHDIWATHCLHKRYNEFFARFSSLHGVFDYFWDFPNSQMLGLFGLTH